MEHKMSESWQKRLESDDLFRREFIILLKEIRSHCLSNIEFFKGGENEKHEKFEAAFRTLFEHLDRGIEPAIERLISVSHQYDFDPQLPANGYRSFVKIIRKCCFKILQLCRTISKNRNSMLFRGGHYGRELTAFVTTLGQLRACIYYLEKLTVYCNEGALFPDEDKMTPDEFRKAEMMMLEVESLRQECFYGRCLGFQYCDSMSKPLTGVCLFMASFSDGYLSESSSTVMRFANSLVGGGRYIIDPELRGEKIVEITRNCDVNFCKAFWATNENDVMHTLPLFVCPPVQLDKVITLPPEEIEIPLLNGEETVSIHPPNAHSGPGPVNCRLISYELREGQETWKAHGARPTHANPTKVHPRAEGLVIHLHGGGFVAQSSASHEVYLRHWAKQLRVPIFSVDYSLAPESPFPRGLEDCFYAYCWAMKNCKTLGSLGLRIAVCGDSAGGNLAVALSMKAAQYGIRVPDGIQTTYACMMIRYSPSASRLMSLMDPLLPIGILSRCLAAYVGITETTGINTPMRSSITKQTLYEFDEQTTNLSAAASEENLAQQSPSNHGTKAVSPTDKLSCDNLEHMSKAYTKSGTITDNKKPGFVETMENLSFEKESSKNPKEKQVSFKDLVSEQELKETKEMFIPKHKPTNSLDSGFVDVEKENNNQNEVSGTNQVTDQDLGISPPSVGPEIVIENHHQVLPATLEPKLKESPKTQLSLNLRERRMKQIGGKNSMAKSPSTPTFPMSDTSHMPTSSGSAYLPAEKASSDQYYPTIDVQSSPKEELSFAQTRHYAQSPMGVQFKELSVSANPYMSPLIADDDMLIGLPPVYFVCCHLDPMLDDSITFAKRLRDLGNEVHLDVLEDLPHGFLNFILVSQEAKQGSDLCVARIKDILTPPEEEEAFEVIDLV